MNTLSKQLSDLAMECLAESEYQKYGDGELMDATEVFMHILMDHIWTENKTLPPEKIEELAFTTSLAVRELIKVSTGKDMHAVARVVYGDNHDC